MTARLRWLLPFVAALTVSAATCTLLPPEPTAGPAAVAAPPPAAPPVALRNAANSLKIAVMGDFGTGSRVQYETAAQMFKTHQTFPYELVLLTGDNLYGSERPQDFEQKFTKPYKPLLDAGVKFYASLGNHDSREQRFFPSFNMNEKLYYSFKAPRQDVRFFALESTYPEPEQIEWLEDELKGAREDWKVVFFHHPLYSSGERHGSDTQLRDVLEPLLIKYNVSMALTGHDHFYERTKPQKGIVYFVVGAGGQLRRGNIDRTTGLTAKGFDTDTSFLVGEFIDNEFIFQAISRTGQIVDSGIVIRRQEEGSSGRDGGAAHFIREGSRF
jgi:predicted MPP superfamily phosphohydrolase